MNWLILTHRVGTRKVGPVGFPEMRQLFWPEQNQRQNSVNPKRLIVLNLSDTGCQS